MVHFLATRRQNKLCRALQTFRQLLTVVGVQTSPYNLDRLLPTFSLLWPWCFDLFLNENLNTEMAKWNSRVCWGVESLKTSKRLCGLVPRLPPKDCIQLYRLAAVWFGSLWRLQLFTKGVWWNRGSQITLSEVLVSGQPIISFVWNSLGEGGASSNTMGSLEAPEQAKAEIWLQKILPCQTAHFSIG